ncbi:DUF2948 family protein [Thermaurantiacus sp.]
MEKRLHLAAVELDEVPAFSALVQDFVLKAADIAFDARGRRLVLLGNRFCWERNAPRRARTALVVSSLLRVARRNWPRSREAPLELLAIEAEPTEAGARLYLHFAGGPALRLEAECIDLLLDDLSDPWPAARTPGHDLG